MPGTFSEYLASLTNSDLSEVLDRDMDDSLPSGETVISLIQNSYPELFEFALDMAGRTGLQHLSREDQEVVTVTCIAIVGVICRKVEIDELPSIE